MVRKLFKLFTKWQGMQYMHNMIDDRSKIEKLDNNRYPQIKWTTVKDVVKYFYDGIDKQGK